MLPLQAKPVTPPLCAQPRTPFLLHPLFLLMARAGRLAALPHIPKCTPLSRKHFWRAAKRPALALLFV